MLAGGSAGLLCFLTTAEHLYGRTQFLVEADGIFEQ